MATNEKNMKTWEQCIDEIANKHNFDSWINVITYYRLDLVGKYIQEAAELYREEGIKDAVKLARERDAISTVQPLFKYTESEIHEKLKL